MGIRQARAGARMRSLEKRGELTSEMCASPGSGLGRLYYRVV